MAGPPHAMAGALAPLDLTGHLFLQIAGSAQALAVVDAGLPASRDGTDVVGLADHRIAVRATADGVPPRQEARHRLGEGARLRFHCYQLSGGRMGVEAAEDSTQVRPIRSDRAVLQIRWLSQRGPQVFADAVDRDRAVSLDLCDVLRTGVDQIAYGDYQPVEQHGRVRGVRALEQRVHRAVGHVRVVTAGVALRMWSFGLEREPLAYQHRTSGRQACVKRC